LNNIKDSVRDNIYDQANLFIMPNIPVIGDVEGFGLVALEASSHGLPIVASGVDGIVDAVIDQKNGFIVKPLSTQDFIDKILTVLFVDGEDLKKMKNNFQRFTLERFDWQKIGALYLQKINEVISRRN
jgi:glycosyltransferase involved in cell wall biosynthesis